MKFKIMLYNFVGIFIFFNFFEAKKDNFEWRNVKADNVLLNLTSPNRDRVSM